MRIGVLIEQIPIRDSDDLEHIGDRIEPAVVLDRLRTVARRMHYMPIPDGVEVHLYITQDQADPGSMLVWAAAEVPAPVPPGPAIDPAYL